MLRNSSRKLKRSCHETAIVTRYNIENVSPTLETKCDTSNGGVKKWYIHGEKCLRFWQKNGAGCANCVAVCPFTTGFEFMQCLECEKCDTVGGCELQVNTHLRLKYGYLGNTDWGEKPQVQRPRRRGL